MRISDWSSDVCSSDLNDQQGKPEGDEYPARRLQQLARLAGEADPRLGRQDLGGGLLHEADRRAEIVALGERRLDGAGRQPEIGRESCRARVCQDGEIPGGAGTLKKPKINTQIQ